MKYIYNQAKWVIVYLGEEIEDTPLAIDLLALLYGGSNRQIARELRICSRLDTGKAMIQLFHRAIIRCRMRCRIASGAIWAFQEDAIVFLGGPIMT
jgi:hypothetical protein